MRWLTQMSVRNPALVLIVSLLVVLGGVFSMAVIQIESEPQAKLGMLTISTAYPQASAEDVLENVTKPLERAVDSVSGMKTYISSSEENHSMLTVSVDAEADLEKVQNEIEKNVAMVKLPSTAGPPKVKLRMIGSEPMYFLAISSNDPDLGNEEFYRLVEDQFVDELETIEGVESADVIGVEERQARIKPNLEVLHHYGISSQELMQAITAQHVVTSAGTVTDQGQDLIARFTNDFTKLEQIRQIKLRLAPGKGGDAGYLPLGELANIDWEINRTSLSRLNGKPAVAVQISKTPEGNIVSVSDQIREKLDAFRIGYPDLKFEMVSDRSDFVKTSIGGMAQEGFVGMLMATVIIYLFLRSFRSTMIVVVSIPLCILISITLMQFNGITINLMSLFGMTVSIGRVVDDSIVVIENIFRRIQTEPRTKETIQHAVGEVVRAITSSTMATVAVFLPIAFVSGLLGDFFKPFAAAVAWSLLASLLVSVTVVPLLASITMRKEKHKEKEYGGGKITRWYAGILRKALEHKGKVALVAFLLFASSAGLASKLPTGFLPELNMDLLYLKLQLPAGTSLETTNAKVQEIEQAVMQEPGVLYIQSKLGAGKGENKQPHLADMTIKLKEGFDQEMVQARVRKRVEPLIPADAQATFSKPAAGGQEGYQLVLYGTDFATLQQTAAMIKEKLNENPLLTNIKDNVSAKRGQVSITVDRDRAMLWGMTPDQVSKQVAAVLGSTKLAAIKQGGVDRALVYGTGDSSDWQQLPQMWVKTPSGQQVELKELAVVRKEKVAPELLRKDGKAYIQITADILSTDKGGVSQAQTRILEKLELPEGVRISAEGISQDMQKGFTEMTAAIGAAILLVLLVMVASFGNLISPLAVLISLPLASIGGLFALWLTRGVMDMTVMIGFLMLIGIVVTNAIVLIDRVQQHITEGVPVRDALIEAGKTRLRPIVMTAVATIAAMLPLAFGFSEGSLLSKGLSTVVIGGLLSSTLMTLVVVPVGYEVLYHWKYARRDRDRKKDGRSQLGGEVRSCG